MYTAHGHFAHLWLRAPDHFSEGPEEEFKVLRPLVRKQCLKDDVGVVLLVHDHDQCQMILVSGWSITEKFRAQRACACPDETILKTVGERRFRFVREC